MLDLKPLNRILFIDIETTSQKENFSDLTEHQQEIFLKRFKKDFQPAFNLKYTEFLNQKSLNNSEVLSSEETIEDGKKKKTTKKKKVEELSIEDIIKGIKLEVATELYNIKAPIFPEFGRILCISVGVLWKNQDEKFYNIKINTFSNEDEKTLLTDFVKHEKLGPIFDKLPGKYDKNQDTWALCAFNGKIFDFPYIAKRLIINSLQLPAMFDYAHLKPWEQLHILDPKETWTFGVWDAAVSLDCLSDVFDVPTPKDGISGADVKDVFYKKKNLKEIAEYCEKDVVALARIYLKMKSMQDEIKVYVQPAKAPVEPEAQVAETDK